MTEEVFSHANAKEAYEAFPADLDAEGWKKRLADLVSMIDHYCIYTTNRPPWEVSATARKARDVVLYTLEDPRIPQLLAALIQIEPLLQAMHKQARANIMAGRAPEESLPANKMLTDLFDAMKAMQQ